MSKVKMLLDVVNEVKKEAPEDVPNWNSKLAEAKVNLHIKWIFQIAMKH